MSERFIQMSDPTGDVLPKASKSINFTLEALEWVDPVSPETYYTQTIDDTTRYPDLALVTSTMDGVLGLDRTATHAQYEAASEAQIRCTGQGPATIIVAAKKKPTVDIPCTIILLG